MGRPGINRLRVAAAQRGMARRGRLVLPQIAPTASSETQKEAIETPMITLIQTNHIRVIQGRRWTTYQTAAHDSLVFSSVTHNPARLRRLPGLSKAGRKIVKTFKPNIL